MSDVKRGIILADLQYPNHNPKLLKLWEQYLSDHEWDYLVYLGDIMDMDAISGHALAAGDIRSLEGKRLKDDYQFISDMLERHTELVGEDCDVYWLAGNHEEWADRLVDKMPGLEGLIEVEHNLPFKELSIQVIAPRKFLKLGSLHFIHGDMDKGYTPVNVAKKLVDTYNRDIIAGHNHTNQAHTRVSPIGINETFSGYSIPCMADVWPSWNKDKPTRWVNGFATFFTSDKTTSVVPILARGNKFIAEGKLYG